MTGGSVKTGQTAGFAVGLCLTLSISACHAQCYVDVIVEMLQLGPMSKVIELGSNDGYLLQYFVKKGIPVLGIEPAINVAVAARQRGVETLTRFFGAAVATELACA